MLIPLSTDRPSRRPALVTPVLVSLNISVFILMLIAPMVSDLTVEQIYRFGQVGGGSIVWYTLITSAFLHGGFVHLLGNMITLWVFGPPVEDRFGRGWFLAFYLAAGAASGLAHALLEAPPAIGASGAIAGVTGAFLVLFPATRVRCLMILFIIGLVMVPSWFLIGLRIAFDLLSQSFGVENNIANIAHLAGYAFGIGVAMTLLWTGMLSREPYDLFTILRHRQRRKSIRAAVDAQAAARAKKLARAEKPDPEADDLARRRARVATLLAEDRAGEAADAYADLLSVYAHRPHAGTLSRDAQLRLVGYLLSTDRRDLAARALEGFLGTYKDDAERDELKILLARIAAHDLGDHARARALLEPIAGQHRDQRLSDLAREELAAIPAGDQP
ncbi:MAG: rhomboid family intramembrane serine protease [Phycisphaerales bacterium]|nr:rhomboid family intramembrane serine protease [Planctomycetota bacterium]MCH8509205.1 rhomboid family intramembrane serine protease [Phycisphaerales bacterium]